MPRACVFVDGENFRHSICDIFSHGEFDARDYLPKEADWANFFDWLVVESCGNQTERLRTYWYVQEEVDFFPYKFPNPRSNPDSLRIVLAKDGEYKKVMAGLSGESLTAWMINTSNILKQRQQEFLSRFRGWHVVQDGIANRHRAVEFRRAGATNYNLFQQKMGKEKAVDVLLATDMIVLQNIYDIAILVSGDQDYVPAVKRVKDAGKTVVNVAFLTRDNKLLPGGARRLHNMTDKSKSVSYVDLMGHLGLQPAPSFSPSA